MTQKGKKLCTITEISSLADIAIMLKVREDVDTNAALKRDRLVIHYGFRFINFINVIIGRLGSVTFYLSKSLRWASQKRKNLEIPRPTFS